MQCHECIFLLMKNTAFRSVGLDLQHLAKMGAAGVYGLHASVPSLRSVLLGMKPLRLGRAGACWRCRSGFSARCVHECACAAALLPAAQLRPSPSSPKRTATTWQRPSGCCEMVLPVWGLLSGCDRWHALSRHAAHGSGGACEAVGKRSLNVLVLLMACRKSLELQWFLAAVAILSLSLVRF